jgi:hypothetical protein
MLTLVAGKKKKKKEKKKKKKKEKRKKKKEKRKKKKEKRKRKKKRKIKGIWLLGSLRASDGACYAWSACLYCCYPHFGL